MLSSWCGVGSGWSVTARFGSVRPVPQLYRTVRWCGGTCLFGYFRCHVMSGSCCSTYGGDYDYKKTSTVITYNTT